MPVNANESVGVLNADEAVEALHATVTEDGTANDGNEKGFELTSIELERLDPAGPIRGCVALLRSLTVATHCARGFPRQELKRTLLSFDEISLLNLPLE